MRPDVVRTFLLEKIDEAAGRWRVGVEALAGSADVTARQTRLAAAFRDAIGPQDAEQNIFGQLAFGMDHADYIIMRAPRPTLVCAATQDFFDIADTRRTVADARRVYELFAAGDRLAMVPAVHAAAVHPEVFASCRCDDPPRSWSSYVADGPLAARPLPLASLVHGALLDYDFPELIALTAPDR